MTTNFYGKKHGKEGVYPIDRNQVKKYNDEGWDIFWTPQEFPKGKRKKEDLISVRYICGDFDNISDDQLRDCIRFTLLPTMIVRTRSGFHVYWQLSDPLVNRPGLDEEFRNFVMDRLVNTIGADARAADVARLLRVPNTRYWSDSKGNVYNDQVIMNELIYNSGRQYTWKQLEKFLPTKRITHKPTTLPIQTYNAAPKQLPISTKTKGNFWEVANAIPPKQALQRLSGSYHIQGEHITFKPIGAGKERILINGKPHHMWIAPDGSIGSSDGGGPSIVNWLNWYHQDMAKVASIIKEVFPDYVQDL